MSKRKQRFISKNVKRQRIEPATDWIVYILVHSALFGAFLLWVYMLTQMVIAGIRIKELRDKALTNHT
jgi:hypothetical protein